MGLENLRAELLLNVGPLREEAEDPRERVGRGVHAGEDESAIGSALVLLYCAELEELTKFGRESRRL